MVPSLETSFLECNGKDVAMTFGDCNKLNNVIALLGTLLGTGTIFHYFSWCY